MYDFTHKYTCFCKNVTGLCPINTKILKNIYFMWYHQKEKACYASLRMILVALLSRFLTGKNFCLDHVLRRTESCPWDSAHLMPGSISPGLASDPVHFKPHFSSTGTSGPDADGSSLIALQPLALQLHVATRLSQPCGWEKYSWMLFPHWQQRSTKVTKKKKRRRKETRNYILLSPPKWNSSVSSPFSKSPKYPKMLLSYNLSRSHKGRRQPSWPTSVEALYFCKYHKSKCWGTRTLVPLPPHHNSPRTWKSPC